MLKHIMVLALVFLQVTGNMKPLLNLPGQELFPSKTGEPFNTFETGLRMRYAYQERTDRR